MEKLKLGEYYFMESENNIRNKYYNKDSLLESLVDFKKKCLDGKALVEDKTLGYNLSSGVISTSDSILEKVSTIKLENIVAKIEDIEIIENQDNITVYGLIKPLNKLLDDFRPTFGIRALSKMDTINNKIYHKDLKIITFDLIDCKLKTSNTNEELKGFCE